MEEDRTSLRMLGSYQAYQAGKLQHMFSSSLLPLVLQTLIGQGI